MYTQSKNKVATIQSYIIQKSSVPLLLHSTTFSSIPRLSRVLIRTFGSKYKQMILKDHVHFYFDNLLPALLDVSFVCVCVCVLVGAYTPVYM